MKEPERSASRIPEPFNNFNDVILFSGLKWARPELTVSSQPLITGLDKFLQ